MIDHDATHLALRNRALSVVVCTTGAQALSATATGFARSIGSFLADGFKVGMEIASSGFTTPANNGVGVISFVSATSMLVSMFVVTITNGAQSVTRPPTVVEAEAAGRTITVRAPSMRAFEGVAFTKAATIPYFDEDYVPAIASLLTATAQNGVIRENGLYVAKWYGVPGVGSSALRKSVDALKALFAPGTILVAGSNVVHIGAAPGPQSGQIIPLDGWAALTLRIPWWVLSTNLVAA